MLFIADSFQSLCALIIHLARSDSKGRSNKMIMCVFSFQQRLTNIIETGATNQQVMYVKHVIHTYTIHVFKDRSTYLTMSSFILTLKRPLINFRYM